SWVVSTTFIAFEMFRLARRCAARHQEDSAMNDMKQRDLKQPQRQVVQGKVRMTPSEAFVETLVAQGVTDVFGIVGSAFMDALDIFPAAGIRFIPVAHEQGAAHMADG